MDQWSNSIEGSFIYWLERIMLLRYASIQCNSVNKSGKFLLFKELPLEFIFPCQSHQLVLGKHTNNHLLTSSCLSLWFMLLHLYWYRYAIRFWPLLCKHTFKGPRIVQVEPSLSFRDGDFGRLEMLLCVLLYGHNYYFDDLLWRK